MLIRTLNLIVFPQTRRLDNYQWGHLNEYLKLKYRIDFFRLLGEIFWLETEGKDLQMEERGKFITWK